MLRDYQLRAVSQIEASQNKNILLQLPTGAGKTYTFREVAKRHFTEHLTKVLILVHRVELMEQAKNSLGERCFEISAGVKTIPHNFDYYVGMVETVNKRLKKIPNFGLVVIDECHFGNFKKMPFFENNCKVLGVTATPVMDEPLSNYYNEMVMPVTINKLIQDKYLLNCKAYGVASDLVGVQKFKERKGEFDEKQLEDFYSSEQMVKNVINAYWNFTPGQKSLIFNVNIKHNDIVFAAFKAEGLNVYKIDSNTPKEERKSILGRFKCEFDAILCNVGVLTTGFDEPSVKAIFLNRATKSLPLYLQMIGRGSRLYAEKEHFTVIDLGKNTARHGFYDDFFDWETYFKHGRKKDKGGKVGAMPIKECPACHFTQHSRKCICENCGHDFVEEQERQKAEEKEQKFVLLQREKPLVLPFDQLFKLAEDREWKPFAVLHKICEHILRYQAKHGDIVTDTWCNLQALQALEKWGEKYNIKANKWYKDTILKTIDEKRIKNSTGNNSSLPK